mgnify:CR=1 FL=1
MSIGLKYDKGKPRMWLLPLLSLVEIARVLTFGAEKYAPNSWQNVENAVERYSNALLRHLASIQDGEIYDQESGLLHWSHVGCNALFLIWLTIKKENNAPYIDIGHRNSA